MTLAAISAQLGAIAEYIMLERQRARDVELDALGRARGMESTIELLSAQLQISQDERRMLMQKLLSMDSGALQVRFQPAPMGAPVDEVPTGGLGVPHPARPFGLSEASLPMPSQVAQGTRRAPPVDRTYDMGNEQSPFSDIGDQRAAEEGFVDDEVTGALAGQLRRPNA